MPQPAKSAALYLQQVMISKYRSSGQVLERSSMRSCPVPSASMASVTLEAAESTSVGTQRFRVDVLLKKTSGQPLASVSDLDESEAI